MGLKEVPLPEPKHLMKADGQLAVVDKMFPNVGMVLARGTANEVKVSFNKGQPLLPALCKGAGFS